MKKENTAVQQKKNRVHALLVVSRLGVGVSLAGHQPAARAVAADGAHVEQSKQGAGHGQGQHGTAARALLSHWSHQGL